MDEVTQLGKELDNTKKELERVRGLLQRLLEHSENVSSEISAMESANGGVSASAWAAHLKADLVIEQVQSTFTAGQGAESADIGKLNSADKSGIDEQFKGMANDEKYHVETLKIEKEFAQSDWEALAGSAETGGENAAPLSDSQMQMWIAVEMFEDDWDEPRPAWEDLPEADRNSYIKMAGAAIRVFGVSNFRRSTESESASSGVEGAHEGTTADKSGALAESSLKEKKK